MLKSSSMPEKENEKRNKRGKWLLRKARRFVRGEEREGWPRTFGFGGALRCQQASGGREGRILGWLVV